MTPPEYTERFDAIAYYLHRTKHQKECGCGNTTCWECSARFLVDYIKRRETASVVSIRAGS